MRVYSTNMTSLLILTLIIWLQVIFVSFLHCKVPLVLPFPYHILCNEVTVLSPHLRSEKLSLTCVRGKYLNKLFGILLHQRFVSSPPCYSVWAHGYLFYTWVIIQYASYLIFCSHCSSFGQRTLFHLTPVSLSNILIVVVLLLLLFVCLF